MIPANIQKILDELEFHSWDSETKCAEFINSFMQMVGTKSALEVGVFRGTTSLFMIDALESGGYTGVDIEDHRPESIKKYFKANKANLIVKNSHEALQELAAKGSKFDLIFIDGLHEFYHALQDFKLSEMLINNGGYILLHDTLLIPDVMKVRDYIKSWGHFDVITLETPDIEGRGGMSGVTVVKCNY